MFDRQVNHRLRSVAFIFFLLSKITFASTSEAEISPSLHQSRMSFDLGYHASAIGKDTLSESVIYEARLKPWLTFEGGLRLQEGFLSLRGLHYKLEPIFHPFSFLELSIRLLNSSFPKDGMGITIALFRFYFHTQPFAWVKLFLGGGYLEKFPKLSGLPILFNFSRDVSDRDFAAQLGSTFFLNNQISSTIELATFDAIQIFNLHNPFLALSADYQPPDAPWKFGLFARYRILLGFGRLDELVMGGRLSVPFD